jgi:hypothetical protein
MLRTVKLAIALLVMPATASNVDASCDQVFEAAAARARPAVAGRNSVDPAHYEESCRTYGSQFFEAVKARQAASVCDDGIDRRRDLEMLDVGIDALNNLIASHCGGS